MKLPAHIEEACEKLRTIPEFKDAATPVRMLCGTAYMAGLTDALKLAQEDPTLSTLRKAGSSSLLGMLDSMRSLFEEATK